MTDTPAPKGKTRDEIAEAYRSEPWWYDLRGFFILTFAYNSTLPAQLRFFGPNFGPDHLELACGTGTLLELVLRWRRWKHLPEVDITGVDYAATMLAGARHRFKAAPRIRFELADAAHMPYSDASFDTINIANSVHCLPDVEGALREAFRVLKPGGTLAANVLLFPTGPFPFRQIAQRINDWGIRKGILYTPYRADDIQDRLRRAGFDLDRATVRGNCLEVLCRKPT